MALKEGREYERASTSAKSGGPVKFRWHGSVAYFSRYFIGHSMKNLRDSSSSIWGSEHAV